MLLLLVASRASAADDLPDPHEFIQRFRQSDAPRWVPMYTMFHHRDDQLHKMMSLLARGGLPFPGNPTRNVRVGPGVLVAGFHGSSLYSAADGLPMPGRGVSSRDPESARDATRDLATAFRRHPAHLDALFSCDAASNAPLVSRASRFAEITGRPNVALVSNFEDFFVSVKRGQHGRMALTFPPQTGLAPIPVDGAEGMHLIENPKVARRTERLLRLPDEKLVARLTRMDAFLQRVGGPGLAARAAPFPALRATLAARVGARFPF